MAFPGFLWEMGGHLTITPSLQGEQSTAMAFHRILAKPFKIRHLFILSLHRHLKCSQNCY